MAAGKIESTKGSLMSGNTVRTPIVDKNGKATHVNKKIQTAGESNRVAAVAAPTNAATEVDTKRLQPADMTFEEIRHAVNHFQPTHRWKKELEHTTKKRVQSLFVYADNPDTVPGTDIPPANVSFERLRSYFAGMHFAKEALSTDERSMLSYAESIMHELDDRAEGRFAR
jgi:hypothetical protein